MRGVFIRASCLCSWNFSQTTPIFCRHLIRPGHSDQSTSGNRSSAAKARTSPLWPMVGKRLPTEPKEPKVIYQSLHLPAEFEGNYPVVGSWIARDEAAGIGIRESDLPITRNNQPIRATSLCSEMSLNVFGCPRAMPAGEFTPRSRWPR